MKKLISIALLSLVFLGGCDFRKVDKGGDSLEGGMKCGAGKCGANMFDGNSALAKKKNNILSQMREKDSRKECVKNAKSTKEAYECVREPNGKNLTKKCGTGKCGDTQPAMKCGAGKCGASMIQEKPKKAPAMKCGAGKCGASMIQEKPSGE